MPGGESAQPQIAAIWAQTVDGVIGNDGAMPWHVPEDFAHFRDTTMGHPVIMGRRTWESFPPTFRPLPGRTNIVITSAPESVSATVGPDDVVVVNSYEDAVERAQAADGGELVWVIGGGQLYRHALQHPRYPVTRAEVSVLELAADGDTHAPQLGNGWRLTEDQDQARSRTGVAWRVQTWVKDQASSS